MGLAHFNEDPRFATQAARIAHREELRQRLQQVFETQDAAHWERALNAAGAPGGRVNSLAQISAHPQFDSRGLFAEIEVTAGGASAPMQLPLAPFSVDGDRGAIQSPPRPVGADTAQVLAQLGIDDTELHALRQAGVV
jgi:crotonobetainyl-CoA:carnitine CoA-transferase CaiB-like acyl-CoA transferase